MLTLALAGDAGIQEMVAAPLFDEVSLRLGFAVVRSLLRSIAVLPLALLVMSSGRSVDSTWPISGAVREISTS
jgi:hypothetical protein